MTDPVPPAFRQHRLPALDGLRALTLVMMTAFGLGLPHVPGFGLTVFFVLSGFLLTWWLADEQDRTGTVDVRAFYARRALRIVPALYVFWVFLVAWQFVRHHPVPWGQALSVLTFTTDYYHSLFGDPGSPFSTLWYVSVEVQFYLLWPFLFLALRRAGDAALGWLAVLVLVVWCWRLLLIYVLHAGQGHLFYAFDVRWDAFLVGALVALAVRAGRAEPLLRCARSPWAAAVTLAVMLVTYQGLDAFGERYRDIVLRGVLPPLAGLLLVQLVQQATSTLWRWLESRPVRYLGRISYGACLYQGVCVSLALKLPGVRPGLVQLVVGLGLTVIAATLSYVVVERPFLRRKPKAAFTE